MPSISLFIPWSNTLNRIFARAVLTSSSGGPSRINLSRVNPSVRDGVLLNAARLVFRGIVEPAARGSVGTALVVLASELALCLPGDRLRAWRRVGEMSLECASRSFCCVSTVAELLVMILAAAPRLCADCSLRNVLCVRGVGGGGGWSSTPTKGGGKKEGNASLVGLCISTYCL